MENRKIYSLNRIAYLIDNNVDVKMFKDDNDKYYAVVDYDVSDLLDKYNKDEHLHNFLASYKKLRLMIKELNK